MKNTGFLLATELPFWQSSRHRPLRRRRSRQMGRLTPFPKPPNPKARRRPSAQDVRLNTGDRAESADPAWEHLKVCDTDSGKLNR